MQSAWRGNASNGINSIKWLADVVGQKTAPGHLMRARGVRAGRVEVIFLHVFIVPHLFEVTLTS